MNHTATTLPIPHTLIRMLDTIVKVDDGELEVQGILKSVYQDKLLVEVDIEDEVPTEFTITATQAAVLGFDLEEFPDRKRYVSYVVNDELKIEQIVK